MAVDFLSRFKFFTKLGARGKIGLLVAGIAAIILVMYMVVRFLSGDDVTTGASSVAGVPADIASVPGGQLTPEYYRALQQANTQAAQQAKISGGSAIPTLIKTNPGAPELGQQGSNNCTIICSEDMVNVKNTLDDWVSTGQISPDVSSALQQLADKKLSVDEFSTELDNMVKTGKLTPEQARRLLEQYKKQHANLRLTESAKVMDTMIKSGALPLNAANDLLIAQKNNVAPAEYTAMLDKLVRSGKVSAETAKTLSDQYAQQRAQETVARRIAAIKAMVANGQLTPEVANALIEKEQQMVPVNDYQATLDGFVNQGKLIPLTANKLLADYREDKSSIGSSGLIYKMLKEAETAAFTNIADLVKATTPALPIDAADKLTGQIHNNVSAEEYQATVQQLQNEKKISPEAAVRLKENYRIVKGLRKMAPILTTMQDNDVTIQAYTEELQRAVSVLELTPDQAAQLLQEYRALKAARAVATSPSVATGAGAGGANSDFAILQQRLAAANATSQSEAAPTFEAPPEAAPAATGLTEQQLAQQRQLEAQIAQQEVQALQAKVTAMAGQAGQLVNAWAPVKMESKQGVEQEDKKDATSGGISGSSGSSSGVTGTALSQAPLLKAGTILFAVLDTAANSDYPDSPVMATVVDGKYKGAKLMGKLTVTKGVSGQMDRISLNFTLMNTDAWESSLAVNAFAIDPDTARTVLASNVDYHYLKRFGAIMATSFLQGYGSAINNAGTSTTGIFGTSTTTPELSPSQKIFSALGQMGKTLGGVTQNYVNTPPTVKVNAGVGLGILFMADITPPNSLTGATPVAVTPTPPSIIPASAIPTAPTIAAVPSVPPQTVVAGMPST